MPCVTIMKKWAELIIAKLKHGQCEGDLKLRRYAGSCVGILLSAGKASRAGKESPLAPKIQWVLSPAAELAPPTCARAGTVACFCLLGPALPIHRERWLEESIQQEMWCTCSKSPVFVSRIQQVWAAKGEEVRARGNLMVQLLRLPARVLQASLPQKEFLEVLRAQPQYERRKANAQSAKIAATQRLLRCLRAGACGSGLRAALVARAESRLTAQEDLLRQLHCTRAQSEAQIAHWLSLVSTD